EPIAMESGGFIEAQNGLVLSPRPGTVDLALLGARPHGVSGEGVIAMVRFRAKAAGDPKIGVAEPHARDAANRPIALGASRVASQPDRPSVTELMPVAPNPSRGNAVFAFSLASVAPVDLTVYAVDGRRVRTVARGVREPGIYRLNWDGRDEQGNDVSSGVFYVRLEAGGQRFTRTLVRMR